MAISVAVSQVLNNVTVETDETVIQEQAPVETITVSTAIPTTVSSASTVGCTPHGTVTATTVQGALEQLADQQFRTTGTPSGTNVEEGDIWYDTDDDQLKVYRETSTNVFEWVAVILGDAASDSDTLDAGSF
jgi:hypothetical protein